MLYRFQYVFYVLVLMVCSVHTKNIYQKLNNIYREEHYFSSGVFSQHDSNKQDAGWYVSVDHVDSGSQSNQIVHQYDQISTVLALTVMQAQLTPAQFQEFCRQQHMRVYGVSTELLKIVSDYDLLRLEEWIASNIQLSRSQALKIWDVVCKTKWCQRTLKRKGRSNLENIFDQREHEVKQKAQELKEAKEKQAQLTHKYQINTNHHCLPRSFENISKLYQLFEAVISTQHDGSVDDQRRWHDCIKAFEQTKNEQFRQYEKSYILTDQAQGYLIAQGLSPSDYQYLKGTTLQHELEHQLCYIFEQAAYRQNKLSYSSNLLKQAVYCADAAHVTNSSELVRLTSLLEDVSYDYLSLHDDVNEYDLKFWIAFGKGVVCSAEKTIEMVLHPLKTAESLGKIIVEIKNMLPVSGNSCPCVFDHNGIQFDETRLQNSAQKIDAVCDGLVSLKREIISWMQNSSMEQKVENIGEIVADCVIPDIVLTKVGQCIGALAAQAKTLRTMEAAGALLEEEWGLQKLLQLGIQQDEVAELLMQTEIGSELVSIGKSKGLIPVTEVLAECMQAEGQANKVMPAVVAGAKRTVAEVATEIRSFGGSIPFDRVELLEEVKLLVDASLLQVNKNIDFSIVDKFSKIKTVYKGQPVTVNVDLKHIMNVEYSFAHDTDVSGYVLNLTGGHFPGSCKALEEVGLVKIKKIKVLNNGCEQYLIKNILTDQVYPKTEFLAGWDIAKIIELGLEVLEDTSAVDNAAKNRGILRAGVTKDGYKISIIFDQISEAEIDLITMWPR